MKDGGNLQELMQKALEGDSMAYAAVLKEISIIVRNFVAKKISRPEDVEDVVQNVLISIHKARHTYDGKRPLMPWVYAIAKFRVTDYLRGRYNANEKGRVQIEDVENILTENVTDDGVDAEYIKKEVNKLKPKQSKIIQLMHYEGYTAKEVAAKMGMKESAVKVAAHRAYKTLKVKLKN